MELVFEAELTAGQNYSPESFRIWERRALVWINCAFRTVKVFSDCHFEVQDFTGGNVNKVCQHLPVADDPGFVSFSPSSAMSDNSSLSEEQERAFYAIGVNKTSLKNSC